MSESENPIQFEHYAHFLTGTIDPSSIETVSRWLMYAKFNRIEKPLTLHINSEGGNLGDAIGIVDLMRGVLPIRTLAYGNLMSAAFVIFAAGEKGYHAKMSKILSECSNLSVKDIKSKFLRPTDTWLSAEDLLEYGIADIIF